MSLFRFFKTRFLNWLRMSERIHVRQHDINNLADLVDLIDRFIDDDLRYPLEWDDFISWTQTEPELETSRSNIGQHEPLAFSKLAEDREKFLVLLIEERNRVAKITGIVAR